MTSYDPMMIIDLGPDKPRQTGPRRVLPGQHIDVGFVITALDDDKPDLRPPGASRESAAPRPGDTKASERVTPPNTSSFRPENKGMGSLELRTDWQWYESTSFGAERT